MSGKFEGLFIFVRLQVIQTQIINDNTRFISRPLGECQSVCETVIEVYVNSIEVVSYKLLISTPKIEVNLKSILSKPK